VSFHLRVTCLGGLGLDSPNVSPVSALLPLDMNLTQVKRRGLIPCKPLADNRAAGYQAIPVTAAYDYVNGTAYQMQMGQADPEHTRDPYVASANQPNPVNGFACGDTNMVYMANYPSLQPARIAGEQPPVRREGMFYPEGLPNGQFFKSEGEVLNPAGGNLRSDEHVDAGVPYSGDLLGMNAGPDLPHQMPIVTAPGPYEPLSGYSATDPLVQRHEGVGMHIHATEANLDVVFSNQKAPVAKRGPFKDNVDRQKTAQTRKIGSCIRCRMQRIRVGILCPQTMLMGVRSHCSCNDLFYAWKSR